MGWHLAVGPLGSLVFLANRVSFITVPPLSFLCIPALQPHAPPYNCENDGKKKNRK
jgi:hypothetical protein